MNKRKKKYTIEDGFKLLNLMSSIGMKCELIGSLGRGDVSYHDIDILILSNFNYKKTKRLLNPQKISKTDWGGYYFHDTKLGDVDIFFTKKDFTY